MTVRNTLLSLWTIFVMSNPVTAAKLTFSTIEGGNGVPLSVAQVGNEDGKDILFIHGFTQSYLSWQMQLDSELAKEFHLTAFDLRGHGTSGKPHEPESYQSSQLWADDVNAVITQRSLDNPVLVGWSWAGFIIMNYVRHYGIDDIAAINLVGANTSLQGPVPPPPPRPGQSTAWLGQMMSADIAENLSGVTTFIDLVTTDPLPADTRHANIVFNMMTPPYVRQAMLGYPSDNSDLADRLTLPVLVSHGTDDLIVSYAGGAAILDILPDGSLSTYDGIGHAPFMEESARFNQELADLVKSLP